MELEKGRKYRIKHSTICEGPVVKVHKTMEGKPCLYDIEVGPGKVRRLPPYLILEVKDLPEEAPDG